MAFGHDWIHSIQGYCPLDVQIIALLTQKTSYDFLCTINSLAIDKVLPLASVSDPDCSLPIAVCQEKRFGRLWQPATEKNMFKQSNGKAWSTPMDEAHISVSCLYDTIHLTSDVMCVPSIEGNPSTIVQKKASNITR